MSWMPDRVRDDILNKVRDYPNEALKAPINVVK